MSNARDQKALELALDVMATMATGAHLRARIQTAILDGMEWVKPKDGTDALVARNAELEAELARTKAFAEVMRIEVDDLKSLDANAEWQRLDAICCEQADQIAEAEKEAETAAAEAYQEGVAEGRSEARGAHAEVFHFLYRWLQARGLCFDDGEGINVNDVEEGLRLFQKEPVAYERQRADEAENQRDQLQARLAAQPDALTGSGAGDGALREDIANLERYLASAGCDRRDGWAPYFRSHPEGEWVKFEDIQTALASHPPATGATSDNGGAE